MDFYTNAYACDDSIFLTGYRDRQKFIDKLPWKPVLYVPSNDGKYRSLEGVSLEQKQFDTFDEFYNYIDENPKTAYGYRKPVYDFLSRSYHGKLDYDETLIRVAIIDLEVDSTEGFPNVKEANQAIIAITHYDSKNDRYYTFGLKDYNPPEDTSYFKFSSEEELLKNYVVFWRKNYPDIISGWNCDGFDILYLVNRLCRLFGERVAKKLSPFGMIEPKRFNVKGNTINTYEICGISSLDYLSLFKKYTYSDQESFRLDYIARVVLGEAEGKIAYEGSLMDLYRDDPQRFYDYNRQDVRLIKLMDAKLKLISLLINMTYWSLQASFNDPYSPVRTWENIISDYLFHERNAVTLAAYEGKEKTEKFRGAYVKGSIIGSHEWVVSFDATSLYPSLMIQYNISPDTLVPAETLPVEIRAGDHSRETLQKYSLCCAGNGEFFSTKYQGFIGHLANQFFQKRQEYKKKMLAVERQIETCTDEVEKKALVIQHSKFKGWQECTKVMINALYGATGNPYFKFYDTRLSEAVTLSGQHVIQQVEKVVNEYLNRLLSTKDVDYFVAGDTDSAIIRLSALVENVCPGENLETVVNFLDRFCKEKLSPVIQAECQRITLTDNCFESRLDFKRETICSRMIITGMKNYLMLICDKEGTRKKTPELKMKGVTAIKSSTPEICRKKLKAAIELTVRGTNEELIQLVDKFRCEFYASPVEKIAFPRGLNDVDSNAIHSRGAGHFNHLLSLHKLDRELPISNKEKVKYVYLKIPNPLDDYVITFRTKLPQEFGLDKYIDYHTQFEKSFLQPLKDITDVLGWTTEAVNQLD